MAEQLDSGCSLEAALAAEPKLLPQHLRQLVTSGAKSGKLADALVQFVDIDRSWVDLGRSIRLAVAYPIVLLSLLALLAVALELFIAPNFLRIYTDFRTALPYPTQMLIWLSGGRIVVIAAIAAASLAALFVVLKVVLPAAFRRRLIQRIPLLGPVIRWRAVALWSRLMELMLMDGTTVPEALQFTAAGVRDANLKAESVRLSNAVAGGQKLADAISRSRRLPASLAPIVRWGEDSGALPEAFRTAGNMFEDRAQLRAAVLLSSLPPILFVVVALGALILLNALLSPLFHLIRGLSTGLW